MMSQQKAWQQEQLRAPILVGKWEAEGTLQMAGGF